jgi:hypothetical protein
VLSSDIPGLCVEDIIKHFKELARTYEVTEMRLGLGVSSLIGKRIAHEELVKLWSEKLEQNRNDWS